MNNIAAFFVAASAAFLLYRFAAFMPRLSGRHGDLRAIQAAHSTLTPRLGSIALVLAMAGAALLLPDGASRLTWLILLGAVPLLVTGWLEDMDYPSPPIVRLLAAFAAVGLLAAVSGEWITSLGIAWADAALAHPLIGVVFTLLVLSGVTHAFNLIDGINGFASGTAIVAALALGIMARAEGLDDLAALAFVLAAACMGFFVFNWPGGLIFLGDAGAYLIGFALGWLGVWVLQAAPHVAPWSVVLILFWPIFEFVYSILRRTVQGRGSMLPDRMHLHQITMRYLLMSPVRQRGRLVANSMAAALLLPLVAVPAVLGFLLRGSNEAAMLAVVGLAIGVYALRVVLLRKARGLRLQGRRALAVKHVAATAQQSVGLIAVSGHAAAISSLSRLSEARDAAMPAIPDLAPKTIWAGGVESYHAGAVALPARPQATETLVD